VVGFTRKKTFAQLRITAAAICPIHNEPWTSREKETMHIRRRNLMYSIGAFALGAAVPMTIRAQQERVGILMLHGKSPGNPNDPNFAPLKGRFESLGWVVRLPDMPWSRSRYLEGHFDQAMAEIADHVRCARRRQAHRPRATAWGSHINGICARRRRSGPGGAGTRSCAAAL
jgi:hypothetical protein